MRTCLVRRMGLCPYEQAWRLQDELAAEIAAGRQPPTLLLLEHPHVYTFGRSGQADNLLWDEAELASRGIQVHWVDRGGDVTYHGPGQLVGYPLLPLGKVDYGADEHSTSYIPQADYVGYLRKLEEVLIRALSTFGVLARRVDGLTGVWVERLPGVAVGEKALIPATSRYAKLAAIGVKVDARGISRHGFALNVNPDMSYWQGIVACGLVGYPLTSLAELLNSLPRMDEVIEAVVRAFGEVFDYQMTRHG